MESFCWLNGKMVPESEAKVSVFDIGLLRGFGVYEGLITHNRKPFMLEAHLGRFHRSASRMGLVIPVLDSAIERAMTELVERNVPEGEALIRVILTGGRTVGVIEYDPKTPTMFILAGKFTPLERRYVEEGCAVSLVDYRRELAEVKSTNYIEAVLLQKTRKEKGALEIVYTEGGQIFECTGSNIFIVKRGVVATPKEGIVAGITREVVLDLARGHIPMEERPVSVAELRSADEVFITGSFKEVVPVIEIDDMKVGKGVPGPITKDIIARFELLAASWGRT